MPYGFSFSWRRALGISAAQARLSRAIGVPLSRSGRQQKIGRLGAGSLTALFVETALSASKGRRPSGQRRRMSNVRVIYTLVVLALGVAYIFGEILGTWALWGTMIVAVLWGLNTFIKIERPSKNIAEGTRAQPSMVSRGGPEESVPYLVRDAGSVRASEAALASASQDLNRMLRALDQDQSAHPLDRHFLMLNIVETTYGRRKVDPEAARICERVGLQHVAEFPTLAPHIEKEFGFIPHVPSFQKLATLLAEKGATDKAVGVCREAIRLGLGDGTQSGFEGRIARIQKAAKAKGSARPSAGS